MSAKKKKKMGVGTKILLVICLIVFCGSGYYLADYFLKAHQAQDSFADLQTEEGGHNLAALYEQNDDIVGWLTVDGTRIDYPVMQTKAEGDDPEYYLHRDFDREYSDAGTPFMDVGSDVFLPTWNWLIYGHHMKSGIMFHDLVKFESEEFYRDHPTFTVETLNGQRQGTYQIIAACYSQIYPEDTDVFKYYEYPGYTDEESFNTYIEGVKALSIYDTGESAVYGDQLVTLSTCAYQTEEGRFFIVGRWTGQ